MISLMWTNHTEYEEYQKLQLSTVDRYQHNNTLCKISSNYYLYLNKNWDIFFFSISHTPSYDVYTVHYNGVQTLQYAIWHKKGLQNIYKTLISSCKLRNVVLGGR